MLYKYGLTIELGCSRHYNLLPRLSFKLYFTKISKFLFGLAGVEILVKSLNVAWHNVGETGVAKSNQIR